MNSSIEYMFRRLPEVKTVLDVGIGAGEPVAYLVRTRPIHLTGIEIWEPFVKRVQKLYDRIIVGDAVKILTEMGTNSFDAVLLLDVIEHQERVNAFKLIAEAERVGKFVMVAGPNRFYPLWADEGNPYQIHHCVVHSWEMKKMGYGVRGTSFANILPVFKSLRLFPHINTRWLAWKNTEGVK